jgi:hypothetical protein
MNFLSHFYFDNSHKDSYHILGVLLPDLIKNADKKWIIHPEKNQHSYIKPQHLALFSGYQKHLAVDRIFHNSAFFKHYQHQFKADLKHALGNSNVKLFFLWCKNLIRKTSIVNSNWGFFFYLYNLRIGFGLKLINKRIDMGKIGGRE